MDITINTPAILFPAISLIMLAYTNRFLSVAALIRELHKEFKANKDEIDLSCQIKHLQTRMRMIKNMQYLGISSLVFASTSMYSMFINNMPIARINFGLAMIMLVTSLMISLMEIRQSTTALEISLRDMKHNS